MSQRWTVGDEERAVHLHVLASGQLQVQVGEQSMTFSCVSRGEGQFDVIQDDRCVRMHVVPDGQGGHWVHDGDRAHHVQPAQGRQRDLGAGSGSGRITAPMPGKLVQILVSVGDHVQVGQPLAVLEAMKMEQQLRSEIIGTVSEIVVRPGDQVSLNALLIQVTADQSEGRPS